jgi:hypothetical protein
MTKAAGAIASSCGPLDRPPLDLAAGEVILRLTSLRINASELPPRYAAATVPMRPGRAVVGESELDRPIQYRPSRVRVSVRIRPSAGLKGRVPGYDADAQGRRGSSSGPGGAQQIPGHTTRIPAGSVGGYVECFCPNWTGTLRPDLTIEG